MNCKEKEKDLIIFFSSQDNKKMWKTMFLNHLLQGVK